MPKKVWVQGPIALDTVVYVSEFPTPGSFVNSLRTEERTGGTAANVALGLCTAAVDTGFVSYLGNDEIGKQLLRVLEHSAIKDLVITQIDDKTNHALVLVDEKSERTIISMTTPHLRELQAAGCFSVVGASALADPSVTHADLLIGSRNDFSSDLNPLDHLGRFTTIVLTDGSNGSVAYSGSGEIKQSAFEVEVKDTTGAGDAFIAGYLAGVAHELNPAQCLEIAGKWAASAVQVNTSIPPAFEVVKAQWGIDLIP